MRFEQIDYPVPYLEDNRFRALLGSKKWNLLPHAIQHRFGKRVQGGASVTYQGIVTRMQMNLAGRILSQLARAIGAPLPFDPACINRPAVVVVTEDAASDGQFWIRQYGRSIGFPQIVHSSKRFAGPTGLEEHIGYRIGMALRVDAKENALVFKSDHYFLALGHTRIRLPRILVPGQLEIRHEDLGNHEFNFSLRLHSNLFGLLIRHEAVFKDAQA